MANHNFIKLMAYVLYLNLSTSFAHDTLQVYKEYHLGEETICHPLGRRSQVSLSEKNISAVIVKPEHFFDRWRVIADQTCRFVFKAARGDHLMAVIQNMSLRSNGTHCIDYIKFKRNDKHETRQLCGQVDRRKVTYRPMQQEAVELTNKKYDLYNQTFEEFDPDGEIETTIFISRAPLQDNEKLDLTIVYTPYKACKNIKKDRDAYRSTTNDSICILKNFFCDGYQNCIFGICPDEEDCASFNDVVSNGVGTNVMISAVTSMLLCFVIFIMALWICKKHRKLCWSSDCAGPRMREDAISPRAERQMSRSGNQSIAVDPMLEVAVMSSVLDKDLPPSYDSLFPDPSSPSTT